MKTAHAFYKKYINGELKLAKWQKVGTACLTIAVAGVIGWLFEFVFYFFNGGMQEWYYQGGNFLPWINIYALGAVMIFALTVKLKKKPWLVFLISAISTSLLELIAGWLIYHIGNGTRYWNYNIEILNFGNIGGFVCFRSFIIFGLAAMMLMYLVIPAIARLSQLMPKNVFLTLSIGLLCIFMADEIYNLLITKMFNLPNAIEIYQANGLKYVAN